MAWTTPKTWTVGEVMTAANVNTHVRDNLGYLYNGLYRPVRAEMVPSATRTSSSATWIQAPPTNTLSLSFTKLDANTKLWVMTMVHFYKQTADAAVEFGYRIDAGTPVRTSHGYVKGVGGDTYNQHCGMNSSAGIAAGTHTIDLMFQMPSGSGNTGWDANFMQTLIAWESY